MKVVAELEANLPPGGGGWQKSVVSAGFGSDMPDLVLKVCKVCKIYERVKVLRL